MLINKNHQAFYHKIDKLGLGLEKSFFFFLIPVEGEIAIDHAVSASSWPY